MCASMPLASSTRTGSICRCICWRRPTAHPAGTSDIQIESARLDRTVRNAITLYQLENEELSELQPLDLCGLLEKAGRLAPDIQRSLEITLTAESGGIEHCAVMGVPDEAEQLLLHLISNALRACDAGGRVWVSLKQKKTGVALRVEDNGCG